MADILEHSPADIIRYLLVAHGIGELPSGTGVMDDWSIFCDVEPDRPDNCITIYNTQGRKHARMQLSGRVVEHYGIQIRVRSRNPKLGYNMAQQIAAELDENVYQERVTIGTAIYCVHSFDRSGNIVAIPKDFSTPTKRLIHTLNGLTNIKQKVNGTGSFN